MKNELRGKYRRLRKEIENKAEKDFEICRSFLNSDLYKNAQLILCYSSLDDEISTQAIIEKTLDDGKILALPACLDLSGNMDFYIINSADELKSGCFGIKEPDTDKCTVLSDYSSSVCIVPAFCYDRNGFRLGYGKGYYDKFLKKFTSVSAGLCYNSFIEDKLPADKFDIPVDFIITENNILCCKGG